MAKITPKTLWLVVRNMHRAQVCEANGSGHFQHLL